MNISTDTVRVLIAEDESSVRLVLEMQLEFTDGIDVIGSVEDGAAAVEACRRDPPDVVVMDLLMPRMNGFEAIEILLEEMPEVGIVAYTAVAGELVRELSWRGKVEVLLKSGSVEPLVEAIRRAADRD